MNQHLYELLKEMELDERKAPAAYQQIINLITDKTERKALKSSQRDEMKHHKRILAIIKKESKRY